MEEHAVYRVLMVEDDRGIAQAVQTQGELWNLQVRQVRDLRPATEEFAELQRVRIDGIDRNVPVIFDSDAAEARRQMLSGDHAQGIYQKLLVVRIRLSDLEKEPRQGMRMWIGSELYKISEVTTEYNELIIELVGEDE